MYIVELISEDGTRGKAFTADLDDLTKLLSLATKPFGAKFEIQRVL